MFTLFHSTFGWSISRKTTPLVLYTVPFDICLIYFAKSYIACVYTVPFDISPMYFAKNYTACTLHCSIRNLADLFREKLHRLYFTLFHSTFGWSISPKATPLVFTLFHSTFGVMLYRSTFQCAISVSRANPFSVCLNHFILFYVVLQTRAELFAFGLVQSTISCSNST